MIQRSRLALVLLLTCAIGLAAISSATDPDTRAFNDAADAWERGDYIAALTGFTKVLNGAAGDAFLDRIALQTGELFVSRELTADGRAPRFSPNGRFIVYQTGLEVSRKTRILRNDATRELVAELPGASATVSADSTKVAYVKIPASADIAAASQALDQANLTASNRTFLINNLAWLIARDGTITSHDLNTQRETELATPGLLKTGLAYAPDGGAIYFLGGTESDPARNDIYAISASGKPSIAADSTGLKSAPVVAASGAALTYVVPAQNVLRRPVPPQPPATQPAVPAPACPPLPRPPAPSAPSFGIVDVATRRVTVVAGTAPALSDDGKTLAYVTTSGGEATLMAGPLLGTAAPIKKINGRLDAPVLTPDGSRITYQRMDQHDWEIYVAKSDGSDERRVTRDIQHDVLPRFVAGGSHLLWVVGEPRHRRSHLLDLAAPAGTAPTRLFHNNTVRTIAPEYQWARQSRRRPDADRRRARRQHRVAAARRLSRRSQAEGGQGRPAAAAEGQPRTAETALKAARHTHVSADCRRRCVRWSDASPSPASSATRRRSSISTRSTSRGPGNRKASEYLFNTYKSFGYDAGVPVVRAAECARRQYRQRASPRSGAR